MENKLCNCCNEYKPISEFPSRNRSTKKGIKLYINPTCRSCSIEKRKEYHRKEKEHKLNFIYRFLDKNKQVLYIGKTNYNLNLRIKNHLTQGHLPESCYKELDKIQFLTTPSKTLTDIKEIYYINLYKPKYNTRYLRDEPVIIIEDFKDDLWEDYNKEDINNLNTQDINDIYSFSNHQVSSIFYRKRNNNYLVYIEVKMNNNNNKKKQIRKGTFKNEKDAEEFVNHLKTLYKPLTRFDMT